MGQPKKKTTRRRTGNRRQHLILKLARAVNRTSPVRVAAPKKVKPQSKPSTPKKQPAKTDSKTTKTKAPKPPVTKPKAS